MKPQVKICCERMELEHYQFEYHNYKKEGEFFTLMDDEHYFTALDDIKYCPFCGEKLQRNH